MSWDNNCNKTLRTRPFPTINPALIVYDLTRPDTLAGYKADLAEERAIPDEELQAICQTSGGTYLDPSAKTGYQVEEAFQLLAQQITS